MLAALLAAGSLPVAAAPALPWLKPLPATGVPTPPPPDNPMPLRPHEPATAASEDVTPESDRPQPFRFLHPAGDPDRLAKHLLVVYNAKYPDSRALAEYYAKRRAIPPERVLALACPVEEEITRAQYEGTIRQPIVAYLFRRKWLDRVPEQAQLRGDTLDLLVATRNDIWTIVLMRGVPLKIRPSADYTGAMQTQPELATNAAAVDSELALLPVFGLPLGGLVPNPFYDGANTGELRAGPEPATRLIFVTRLDGPSPACVRRMIDDSLAAEKQRLAGSAVVDSRGFTDPKNPYTEGDVWLRRARDLLRADGWTVTFDDRPETLPATEPLDQVALYLGWYASSARGPWVTPPRRFVPGAIAYHLHSFSAETIRTTTEHWVGPLLQNGAAATMGDVYEPYLVFTPHSDIFTRRLLDGDTFAEAAYAAQPALSWMGTVVGDPLYRPFRVPLEEALDAAGPGPNDQRDWLLLQQAQRRFAQAPYPDTVTLQAALDVPGAGAVAHERLGEWLDRSPDPTAGEAAVRALRQAMVSSPQPIDHIRIGLKLAQVYASRRRENEAQAELRAMRELYPFDAAKYGLYQGWFFNGL